MRVLKDFRWGSYSVTHMHSFKQTKIIWCKSGNLLKQVKKFSHTSVNSLILCVFTVLHMLTEVTRIIQGRKGAKQRICGRLSAVFVHGVIRAGRPHPLCQQTVKHYSHSLLVKNGSLRCENIEKSANQGSLWYGTLHDGHRHLSEAKRELLRCWPSTFRLISINTASKRARFVFKVLSKGWDVRVSSKDEMWQWWASEWICTLMWAEELRHKGST